MILWDVNKKEKVHFFEKKVGKSLVVRKKAVPLHSLSGSNTATHESKDDP